MPRCGTPADGAAGRKPGSSSSFRAADRLPQIAVPDTQLLHVPAVEFAQRTDPGRDPEKQVNEDAGDHRETRFGHLCVVCDGMGGHSGGREASNLALATILDAFD